MQYSFEDMKMWIGRTYRKFIGEEIIYNTAIKNPNRRNIFVDGNKYLHTIPIFPITIVLQEESLIIFILQ